MILQLNPTIMVDTPLGRGQALFIIDYGMHQNSCWVVGLHKNGIVKHFDTNDVIISPNYTYHINQEKYSNINESNIQEPKENNEYQDDKGNLKKINF